MYIILISKILVVLAWLHVCLTIRLIPKKNRPKSLVSKARSLGINPPRWPTGIQHPWLACQGDQDHLRLIAVDAIGGVGIRPKKQTVDWMIGHIWFFYEGTAFMVRNLEFPTGFGVSLLRIYMCWDVWHIFMLLLRTPRKLPQCLSHGVCESQQIDDLQLLIDEIWSKNRLMLVGWY